VKICCLGAISTILPRYTVRHVLDNSQIVADEEQRDERKTSTHEGLWKDRNNLRPRTPAVRQIDLYQGDRRSLGHT
jgi:hypothetical protein